MKPSLLHILAIVCPLAVTSSWSSTLMADSCMTVTLTGTQGGPLLFNGLAGSGTLVQFGDTENDCSTTLLQFDTGRGTNQQLSKLGVSAAKLDAVFLTHMHSDHTEGLTDIAQLRWHSNSAESKLDLVCSTDVKTENDYALSCAGFAAHVADALIYSGEISQRLAENPKRLPGGPADAIELQAFEVSDKPQVVWESGSVKVSAIGSTHIGGHASYRVDTPAGSVVIGGDAGNDLPAPPRPSSTSEQVELLAEGADILVHSTIHPAMGPDLRSGFPAPIFYRQSTASDLGALADRAGVKHLMLTHLNPPLGAVSQGPYPVPGGPLTETSYEEAVLESGYKGDTIVGTDLVSITLTAD